MSICSSFPCWAIAVSLVSTVQAVRLTNDLTTRCSAAVHTPAASIVCHFSVDLSLTLDSVAVIAVERRDLNNSYAKHSVIECFWQTNVTWGCKVHAGYTSNEQVSDKLAAEIPHFTTEFEGTYICYVKSPNWESQNDECLLDGRTPDSGPLEQGEADAWTTPVGVIAGVLLALTAVVAVGLVLLRRRSRATQLQRFSRLSESTENVS